MFNLFINKVNNSYRHTYYVAYIRDDMILKYNEKMFLINFYKTPIVIIGVWINFSFNI